MNAAAFLSGLARVSWQAGILVALVLFVQWIFRRQLLPRWRCALWMLVFARLLLPVSPGSVVSVFNWLPRFSAAREAPPVSSSPPRPSVPSVPFVAAPDPEALAAFPRQEPLSGTGVSPVRTHRRDARATTAAPAAAPATAPWHWPEILLAFWSAGAGIFALFVAISSWRVARRFARLTPTTDPATLAVLKDCRARMGVPRLLTISESARVASPVLHGFLRPRLILPRGFLTKFSAEELRFVLLHELAHIRRRDIAMNWLVAALQILHWFNPLLWLAAARWRADRELDCDALALEAAGPERNREYGQTILRLLEDVGPRAGVPALVGILEDTSGLKRRLAMIASHRPGRRLGFLPAVLLTALGIVCLTDAQSPKPKSQRAAPPGPEPLITESTNLDPGDQDLELPSHRSSDPNELTVLQPDGKPAAGARLWVHTMGDWGHLWIAAPGRYSAFLLPQRQAGDDGRIKLPETPANARVVIAHANGFLTAPIAELQRTGEAHLRAYGTVEGQLLEAGKPRSGVDVGLKNLTGSRSLALELSYTTTTDSDGRFVFTQVPAGEYKLCRLAMPQGLHGGFRRITETYQMPVTIQAGQTNKVEYTSTGSVVIGRATTMPFDLPVNWRNDVHTLSLKLPGGLPSRRPNLRYNAMIDAYVKDDDLEGDDLLFREAQVKRARLERTYALEIGNDGSFRVEDVPPGVYELRIRVTDPDGWQDYVSSGNEKELGSLISEIVVAEPLDFGIEKQPLDLGTLTLAMRIPVSTR